MSRWRCHVNVITLFHFFTAPIFFFLPTQNIWTGESLIVVICSKQWRCSCLDVKRCRYVTLCKHWKSKYPLSDVQALQALYHGFLHLCWVQKWVVPMTNWSNCGWIRTKEASKCTGLGMNFVSLLPLRIGWRILWQMWDWDIVYLTILMRKWVSIYYISSVYFNFHLFLYL